MRLVFLAMKMMREVFCGYCLRQLSLRSRRLEVVGTRKNGRAKRRHARGGGDRESSLTPRVSPSRAPVLSFTHYFQAPATQAKNNLDEWT